MRPDDTDGTANRRRAVESRWVATAFGRVHARVVASPAPRRPVIVLVHGIGVSSRYMMPVARDLSQAADVWAPDLPGFGLSVKPRRVLGLSDLADALAAWLRAAGIDHPALLGNSFGCQIIAELAVRHPETNGPLILQGPTMDPAARTAARQLLRWMKNSPREPRARGLPLGLVVLRDYLDCGLRRLLATFRVALADRIEEKLPDIQTPTLVVRGARDPIAPQRWVEEARRLLPRGRLAVVPKAAHTMCYTSPAELARVTLAFLEDVAPVASRPGTAA